MNCSAFYYSGLSQCRAFREKVMGIIMSNKDITQTKTEAASLAYWIGLMADADAPTAIYIPFDRGYQNNTSEPEITTSNLGYSEKTNDFAPIIKGFGNFNYEDYQAFFAGDNQDFNFWLVLKDGTIEGLELSDGNVRGRRGKMFVMYNAPNADNLQESFPIDISFVDVNEWKANSVTIATDFTPTEILDSVPVGLNIDVVTPYAAGGNVVVKATKRNQPGVPHPGLDDVADWKVLAVKADLDVAITQVDATSGQFGIYTLTIQKDAGSVPADLTDDVVIRAMDLNGGAELAYVSQPLVIPV